VKRREFIAGLGAAAWPVVARAQRVASTPKVGVLMAGAENAQENRPRVAAFRQGLAELGWKEGENVHVEYRWSTGKSELIRQYSEELVAFAPDVIVANSTPVVTAFKSMTTSIPVVFALAMDPVGLGHVKSLSRPGGNFTGFTFIDPEMVGKWMELLKDIAPGLTRAAVIFNPATTPTYDKWVKELEAARHSGAADIVAMPVGSTEEMEVGIKLHAQRPGSGLIVGPDPFNQVRVRQIAQLAGRNRLPAISVYRPFVVEGGLMMYGPDTADIFRRAAGYVDRVLKGEKPSDLPVQNPTKYELVINLRTAKALGFEVPARLLFTADEVIE
jgi:putative tryptophan/tyrosine transport system substrate-binding protein